MMFYVFIKSNFIMFIILTALCLDLILFCAFCDYIVFILFPAVLLVFYISSLPFFATQSLR